MKNSTMKWVKKGMIIKPRVEFSWMRTHAMIPVAELVEKDIFRIYFSGRDDQNRSLIGFVHIDINKPDQIISISEKPVFGLGELGCFDDNGVTPSWIVDYQGKKYLYYIGWNKGSTVRMGLIAGLAISSDGGRTFQRHSRAPLLERTNEEPFSILTAPCVLRENNRWRMWYVSCIGWENNDLPRYNIKYAESKDGINWDRKGAVCIDFKSDQENALARPCVLKEDGIYKMWFSYKGEDYRLGYAESKDGISWARRDETVGIDVSPSGWDSQMIEYAYVISHQGKKHMFYNGNNYGKDGIGYAVSE